ncbi:MAG: PAS domain S-box protein [Zoogloeaceae bacterium]|nr:PAS domain S-box protein [Rhodocyclaceae bacterium]MCP5237706.1 PAS domain S-box protein [Zoogloeaceae bacterium]
MMNIDLKQATCESDLLSGDRRFRAFFDLSPDPAWIIADGRFVECNQAALFALGYRDRSDVVGSHPSELSPEFQPGGEPSSEKAERMMALAREQGVHRFEWVHLRADGSPMWTEVTLSDVAVQDRPVIFCSWRDVTERKRHDQREQLRLSVLEKTALGAGLPEVLTDLVLACETELPGAIGSVMTLDVNRQQLLPAAAPNLPEFFMNTVRDGLMIGSGVGSCGAAAFDRQRVVVEDISRHPNWVVAVDLAEQAGLRACWSQPILDPRGRVLGTFACYYREPKRASDGDLRVLSAYAGLAAVAIERVHDLRKLEQGDSWRRPLIEQSRDGIVFLDHTGAVQDANAGLAEMLGYSMAELRKLHVWDWEAELTRQELLAGLQNISEQGDRFQSVQRRKDGTRIHVDITSTAVMVEDRKLIMAVIRDISDRIRAERALADHKDKLEQQVAERTAMVRQQARIIDQSHDSIVTTDLDGIITSWNLGAIRLFGLSQDAAVGEHLSIVFPPSEHEFLRQQVLEPLKREGRHERDVRMWRSDRQPIDVHLSLSLLFDDNGEAVGMVGYSMDITDRKRMENALRRSEANLAHAQAIAHVGSWHYDLDSDVLTWSDETYRIFGVAIGEAVTFDASIAAIPQSDRDMVAAEWHAALTGKPYDVEHRIIVDGEQKWLRQMAELRFDRSGIAVSAVGTVQDITELKRAEQATRDALQEARRLARLRSEFVANMSHEIRTPLNAVTGLARAGMRGQPADETIETFSRIAGASQHLMRVVNDVLDFAKIDAGKLALEPRPFRLPETLENVLFLIRPQAEAKRLRVDLTTDAGMPTWIFGDVLRVEQVLLNLLSNAVKFTERGAVELRVSTAGDALVFDIADTGVGMTETQLGQLFQPFEQADSSATRRFGGTGLGLSISHNLVSLMGGRIDVVSAPGAGTTFTVRLPLEEVAPPEEPAAQELADEEMQLRGVRVLAAEDVELNQLVLEDMLSYQGAEVTITENGVDLLARIDEAGADAFDVVLMDIQMPEMDGLEATRLLLQRTADLPVIGLTAHALAEDRQRCLDAGMVHHVPKPVDEAGLVAAILRHLRESKRENPGLSRFGRDPGQA